MIQDICIRVDKFINNSIYSTSDELDNLLILIIESEFKNLIGEKFLGDNVTQKQLSTFRNILFSLHASLIEDNGFSNYITVCVKNYNTFYNELMTGDVFKTMRINDTTSLTSLDKTAVAIYVAFTHDKMLFE